MEAASAISTLHLCRALNCSPAELEEMDPQFIADAVVVLRYESQLAEAKMRK